MAQPHSSLAPPKLIPPTVRHLTLEYLGFRNGRDRREYLLCARSGTEAREYTVWIANAAFTAGRALYQDGPDISYQKLLRELAHLELTGARCVEVTESELLDYRTAHAPPTRRSLSPKPSPESPSASPSALPPNKRG
jgi:hypothetical protein